MLTFNDIEKSTQYISTPHQNMDAAQIKIAIKHCLADEDLAILLYSIVNKCNIIINILDNYIVNICFRNTNMSIFIKY